MELVVTPSGFSSLFFQSVAQAEVHGILCILTRSEPAAQSGSALF
jgi:hypothetical protein